jgi:predicted ATPase/DNA-binding XRE family transcriptional regulator
MEAASRLHFGTLLRQFRLDAGMTQQQLAERAKLSVEAIGALERGARTRPYRQTIVLLARALQLSPEREALLEGAIAVAHSPRRRRRIEALQPSLLRIVRRDTLATRRHNLPQPVTSFVARQDEIRELTALLGEHRLLTIVGAGGVGKTRIAVQLGSELLEACPDGVWLIDLAPLADQALVASAVLTALYLPATAGSALGVLTAYLKTRRLVLIMDNCEHVAAGASEVATSIAQACSEVRVLSTSREALQIPGEQVYRLPSLAVPPDSRADAQNVLSYGAVTLFIDRAVGANSQFALTADNARDVGEICRRLDGIPLAIELAAARVKVLAPRQIAERLDQRFRLLTDGNARTLPRHQTMTALIDWSYDLLTPREQRFFESLSVFAGGCTLDAATGICTADGEDDLDVVDLITSLVSKSLLVAELAGNEQRYYLLESARQYAREKLVARGEECVLARRHALFYVELAEQRQCEWDTMADREWLPQATEELENWRSLFEWALARAGDILLGQRLAAVRPVMWRGFPLAEGRRWVRAAIELAHEGTPPELIARLEHSEAEGARRFGEFQVAFKSAARALRRYRELGDAMEIAQMQSLTGGMLAMVGEYQKAEPLMRDALEAADSIGDRRLRASTLFWLGVARMGVANYAGANTFLTEALGLAKLLGADILGVSASTALALNEYLTGNAEIALRLIEAVLADYRSMNALGIIASSAYLLTDRTTYLIALGRYDEARVQAQETLALGRDSELAFVIARSLQQLAVVALMGPQVKASPTEGRDSEIARLFGFAEARFTTFRSSEDTSREYYQSALAVLREAIGADELTRLMAIGATMTEDEAVAQAQALE